MNGALSVEKIGGTSMAAVETVLQNVLIAGRSGDDLYNRIMIVSAYAGITDLLLEHKKTGEPGIHGCFLANEPGKPWRQALERARAAMLRRNEEMLVGADSRTQADRFVHERLDAIVACLEDLERLRDHRSFRLAPLLGTVREMLAGLGEAHSAHNTVLLLRDRGVDAVLVDLTNWDDSELPELDDRIAAALQPLDLARQLPVVTGYVACARGMVSQYDRGYSEITFARTAVLAGARQAVIHKEFHLSNADPKLVGPDRASKIGRTNYDVADQLANLGMEAIHPGAARELRRAGIDLKVRNTFDREDDGTLICSDHVSEEPGVQIITGVPSLFALQFFDQEMLGEKGYDAGILDALARHGAWIVSKTSNANTITHYLTTDAATIDRVVKDLESRFPTAAVTVSRVSMVSLVGCDVSSPALTAEAMKALVENGIGVLGFQHQICGSDIQLVIETRHYEAAVRALHDAMIGRPDQSNRSGESQAAAAAA